VTKEPQLLIFTTMVGKLTLQDSRYNYPYKGFTSIVNQIIVLAKIHYDTYNNYDIIVEDSQILDIFENKYLLKELDHIYDVSPIFFDRFFSGFYDNDKNAHKLVDTDDLTKRNPNNFLTIKPKHLDYFKKLRELYFKNDKILGVQIRGTDKSTELVRIPESNVIYHIDVALKSDTRLNKIFVATDDFTYLDLIINHYGTEMVIYNQENTISRDGQPLHTTNDRKRINLEVMSDVYLLSKCDYILYSFSNVSFLALSMIENRNKILTNINL